jgi:hypothetical protein
VDDTGKIVREVKVATSEPDALLALQTLVSLTDTSSPAKWSMLRFSF